MVTITVGGNDICSFVCLMNNPETLPRIHRLSLTKALRYIRDNLPRTFVNIVSVPSVETVMLLKRKPESCKFIHRGECSCWVGTINNVTKHSRERLINSHYKMKISKEKFVLIIQLYFSDGKKFNKNL